MRKTIAAVVLAALAAMTMTVAAVATPPKAATLTFTMTATGATTAAGTWTTSTSAAPLAGKSGSVAQTIRITGKGKGKGAKTGQVVHGKKTVTAGDGTFVIRFVGHLKGTSATTAEVHGRFVLGKGTGAYAGLHGTGRIDASLNFATGAIVATYTGRVHADHSS